MSDIATVGRGVPDSVAMMILILEVCAATIFTIVAIISEPLVSIATNRTTEAEQGAGDPPPPFGGEAMLAVALAKFEGSRSRIDNIEAKLGISAALAGALLVLIVTALLDTQYRNHVGPLEWVFAGFAVAFAVEAAGYSLAGLRPADWQALPDLSDVTRRDHDAAGAGIPAEVMTNALCWYAVTEVAQAAATNGPGLAWKVQCVRLVWATSSLALGFTVAAGLTHLLWPLVVA